MAAGHLLIVTPQPDLLHSLAFALEANGYQVTAFEALPPRSCTGAPAFDCSIIDQKAFVGEPYETVAFCIKSLPIVLLADTPIGWIAEWAAAVVELPVAGDALIEAVDKAIHAETETPA
jgi:hypothetical protein